MSRYGQVAAVCWRLYRRWKARRGWWLRPADGLPPIYQQIPREQLGRLMRAVRTEFVADTDRGE